MLRNLPSISANKLILSSKITLSERSCILSGFISRKKATTVLKTRLSLKERWEYAAGSLGGGGGVEVPVNHEIQIKQRFSITKQERCTQYEEFNAL